MQGIPRTGRSRRTVTVLLMLAFVVLMGHTRQGCGTKIRALDASTFAKIHTGQSTDEVRKLTGDPDTTTSFVDEGTSGECWQWDARSGSSIATNKRYWVCFTSGKVSTAELRTGDAAH